MPKPTIPNYTIVRDTREKEGFGWIFDKQSNKAKNPRCEGTIIKTLDTADYSLVGYEDILRIERKDSFSELWVNYSNRQLFEYEMERLADFKYKYVIIETSLQKEHFDLSPPQFRTSVPGKSLIRWLISLGIKYNINIMTVGQCGKLLCRTIFQEVVRQEKSRWK